MQKVALRKLIMIDRAANINDLRIPPGNHLEKLVGNREDQYSIKVNRKYRICCSIEKQNDISNVEIVDYH